MHDTCNNIFLIVHIAENFTVLFMMNSWSIPYLYFVLLLSILLKHIFFVPNKSSFYWNFRNAWCLCQNIIYQPSWPTSRYKDIAKLCMKAIFVENICHVSYLLYHHFKEVVESELFLVGIFFRDCRDWNLYRAVAFFCIFNCIILALCCHY